jgi:Family of unknown function (DUF6314)
VEPDEQGRYHDGSGEETFRSPAGATEAAAARDAEPRAAGGVTADLLVYLRGSWRIERQLLDHASSVRGRFDGEGTFVPLDRTATLAYRETGELRFGDYRGPACRELIYRNGPDGTVDVRFADGREFYRLDPRSGSWRGQHPCGSDHYEVTGRLLGADRFQERWRAHGPDKDYEIVTAFVRVESWPT